MKGGLRHQALLLTAANGVTRVAGFLMRLLLARLLGAEALGLTELASSAGMLAVTPVTAGLPTAMSRLAAKGAPCDQQQVLRAGLRLSLRAGAVLSPLLLALSPLLARLLGDSRVLPALAAFSPAPLLLGLCSVYSGWSCGRGDAALPAGCECLEQGVRVALCTLLLLALPQLSLPLRAAVPSLAGSVAALCAVLLFRRRVPRAVCAPPPSRVLQRQLARLAVPTTLSRLCVTGSRALLAVLLPACLRLSGLTGAAATAQYGLLSGMALPLCMLPGIFTGALGMVASPALSAREDSPARLKRTSRKLLLTGLLAGVACAAGLLLLAEPVARIVYGVPELGPLLRLLSPLAVVTALHPVCAGMAAGLGLQRRTLTGTVAGSCVTLALTALLARTPRLRLFGAALALLAGQSVSLLWELAVLRHARRKIYNRAQAEGIAVSAKKV